MLGVLPIELGTKQMYLALDRIGAPLDRRFRGGENAAQGLKGLAPKLTNEQALAGIHSMLEAMNYRHMRPSTFQAFGDALATLARRVTDEQVAVVGEDLIDRMQRTASWVRKVQEYGAESRLAWSWPHLPDPYPPGVSEAQFSCNYNLLIAYGETLGALAPRIEGELAWRGFETGVSSLVVLYEADPERLRALGDGLVALAERLPAKRVSAALLRLFAALEQPLEFFVPTVLQRAVAVVAGRLNDEPDAARVETLLAQITGTPAIGVRRLDALVTGLESLLGLTRA